MERSTVSKIIVGLLVIMSLYHLARIFWLEPWLEEKISTTINEKNNSYQIEFKEVNVSILTSGIELKTISIQSKEEHKNAIKGEINFIEISGINLWKLIISKDISINELIISKPKFTGAFSATHNKEKQATLIPRNVQIDKILLDTLDVDLEQDSSAKAYSIKKAVLRIYNLQLIKNDTLSPSLINRFDFKAEELQMVNADSMYTFKVNDLTFTDKLNKLKIATFSIQPNYSNYEFTSRHRYEIDRFEAVLDSIKIHDFNPSTFLDSQNLQSSYVEIAKMDLSIFRDKRKAEEQIVKTEFQDLIYNYPGTLNIDSIGIIHGEVTYIEHAEMADKAGRISFNEIAAKIYKVSNLPKYKTDNDFLSLQAKCLLMDAGQIDIALKAKLYDPNNTFEVVGTVSAMKGSTLNPMVSRNAFVYITAGRINQMDFNFVANSAESNGTMTLLYQDLDLRVKNKQTSDTTGLISKFISLFAKTKVLKSNPYKNDTVRIGEIHFSRNPNKSLFNYVSKSVTSGVKSTVVE